MNTAYVCRHRGKRGLRFVCKCGSRTWLRTDKQEYIKIDERKQARVFAKYIIEIVALKNSLAG